MSQYKIADRAPRRPAGKRRIVRSVLSFLLIGIAGIAFLLMREGRRDTRAVAQDEPAAPLSFSLPAERLVYDIRLGKMFLGQSVLESGGTASCEGMTANLVIFRTKVAGFTDTETIYSDPRTLLPLRIEREIVQWFRPERIVERYDHDAGTLTITKKTGTREETIVLTGDGPINNPILLPYQVRYQPGVMSGDEYVVRLPKETFRIKRTGQERLTVPAGSFEAYHFSSDPRKFELWISADERCLPLRIQGIGPFGYVLELKSVTPVSAEGATAGGRS